MYTAQDIEAVRGDTWATVMNFTDADGGAISIAGWTIFFTLKIGKDDPDSEAIISKNITSHTNPTGGISGITLTAAETDDLDESYFYDIQIKKNTGVIATILKGEMKFVDDVTRRTT